MKTYYDDKIKDYVYYASDIVVATAVTPNDDYTLDVALSNGSTVNFDMKPLLGKKVYQPLNDISFFKQATVQHGTVCWNDEIDLAPEHLSE